MLATNILLVFACSVLLGTVIGDVPHTRKYFYVGGEYVTDTGGNHYFMNQMYVEELKPAVGVTKPWPLVLIHGFGQTGTNFLDKPDGNPGWASYFLSKGYMVYIVDQPSRGRSPWLPPPVNNATPLAVVNAETIERRFTAAENFNDPVPYPAANLHAKWPGGRGKGVRGQPAFDAFYASQAPSVFAPALQQLASQAAGAALLDRIGKPVVLIGHSEGGAHPWVIADVRPKLVKAIIAMEPVGPPFGQLGPDGRATQRRWGVTSSSMTYEPPVTDPDLDIPKKVLVANSSSVENCTLQADMPPPRKLVNLNDIPAMVVTAEASFAMQHDWCTVAFLRQAGVQAKHLQLGEVGIKGNGHMFFLETNSDEIAAEVLKWVKGLK